MQINSTVRKFQSTPPVWAETNTIVRALIPIFISIHSARVGGDCSKPLFYLQSPISIHSARVGGDTAGYTSDPGCQYISIHSARVGGDL